MSAKTFLAVDLGASSGRHLAGSFDGRRLALEEIYRFPNGPVPAGGHLYWDLLGLWSHVRDGLRAAATRGGVVSVGVDTWGVDFALLGRGDELLGNPYHYRDARTEGALEKALSIVPREEIFARTGLQFIQFNTLYQLLAMHWSSSPLLEAAERLLMMPDVFHWLLTGEKVNEYTDATTTQFYNPVAGDWAKDLIEKFGLPTTILGPLATPGTTLGLVSQAVASDVGLTGAKVVLPGTHDTASAVAAVPARSKAGAKPDWCYISSGTWSLMGVETPRPVINEKCRELNFTNEGGVGGTTRLLKNIGGLWLVQECRRIWNSSGKSFSWDDLTRLAGEATPLRSVVNPDNSSLWAPAHMPDAIRACCRRTGEPVPETEGQVIRCALESLALKYRQVLGWLEELIEGRIHTIHIVGGGVQNRQLCQMTADACARPVVAGPIEATAIGNVMVQAIAVGEAASIADAREIVLQSFPVDHYEPARTENWDAAFERFKRLT
jgi:rhamnulokinase